MAWAPKVVAAYQTFLPKPVKVHTAIPPFHLGGTMVDVAEFHLPDGSVVYGTAGVSEDGGFSANEFVLHASKPEDALAEMVARIGGSRRSFVHGGTLPMAGPSDAPPILDGVGFFYSGRRLPVEEVSASLLQIVGLTTEEIEVARRDSLSTVEAMWWKDGRSRLCDPCAGTSPSIVGRAPVYPDTGLETISSSGRDVINIAIHCDHDGAEGIRGQFDESEAKQLATILADRMPHPSQLACGLHAMMDFKFEELRPLCLRLLQVSPKDYMAQQWYADALAMLALIESGNWDDWDIYFEYESDFVKSCAEAERRRNAAGIGLEFGLVDSPFV